MALSGRAPDGPYACSPLGRQAAPIAADHACPCGGAQPPDGRDGRARSPLSCRRRTGTSVAPTDLHNQALYINRELSWLEFNQRVLMQARDAYHPLLERVKFLAIVGTNLDEFFMVRVATLLKKYRAGMEDVAPDGQNTEQQLRAIILRARRMLDEQAACWSDELRPMLAAEGITFLEPADYTPAVAAWLARYFKTEILPVLTPAGLRPRATRSRTSRTSA